MCRREPDRAAGLPKEPRRPTPSHDPRVSGCPPDNLFRTMMRGFGARLASTTWGPLPIIHRTGEIEAHLTMFASGPRQSL